MKSFLTIGSFSIISLFNYFEKCSYPDNLSNYFFISCDKDFTKNLKMVSRNNKFNLEKIDNSNFQNPSKLKKLESMFISLSKKLSKSSELIIFYDDSYLSNIYLIKQLYDFCCAKKIQLKIFCIGSNKFNQSELLDKYLVSKILYIQDESLAKSGVIRSEFVKTYEKDIQKYIKICTSEII